MKNMCDMQIDVQQVPVAFKLRQIFGLTMGETDKKVVVSIRLIASFEMVYNILKVDTYIISYDLQKIRITHIVILWDILNYVRKARRQVPIAQKYSGICVQQAFVAQPVAHNLSFISNSSFYCF